MIQLLDMPEKRKAETPVSCRLLLARTITPIRIMIALVLFVSLLESVSTQQASKLSIAIFIINLNINFFKFG